MKYLKWFMWTLYYLPQRKPRDFGKYMRRALRTIPPWRKFKPNVYHCEIGDEWHVYLANESCYVIPNVMLKVNLFVTRDSTPECAGFEVYDETLLGAAVSAVQSLKQRKA